jgi:hypothetical protein
VKAKAISEIHVCTSSPSHISLYFHLRRSCAESLEEEKYRIICKEREAHAEEEAK